MSKDAPKSADTPQQEMVPAAALASLQAELAQRDAALAAATEMAQLNATQAALYAEKVKALDLLNKALEQQKAVAEQKAEEASKDANVSRASSKARYRIVLDEARDKNDYREVPVSVNGRAYQLKRAVEIDVPREVMSVLNDAVIGRAEPVEDEKGILSGVQFVNARRFPFQYKGQSIDEQGSYMNGFEPLA